MEVDSVRPVEVDLRALKALELGLQVLLRDTNLFGNNFLEVEDLPVHEESLKLLLNLLVLRHRGLKHI